MQRIAPTKFWTFSAALFADQEAYYDERVWGERRDETYERLAGVADGVGVARREVLDLLKVGEGRNEGNQVTGDIKLLVKVRVWG